MSTLSKIKNILKSKPVDCYKGGKYIVSYTNRNLSEYKEFLSGFIQRFACFETIYEVLAWLQSGNKIGKCAVCGKRIKYGYFFKKNGGLFCSMDCRRSEAGVKLLRKHQEQGLMEKHGVRCGYEMRLRRPKGKADFSLESLAKLVATDYKMIDKNIVKFGNTIVKVHNLDVSGNYGKFAILDETRKTESSNGRMIHIFEDELVSKRRIIKNRLLSILGKTPGKIFARKCEVRTVEYRIADKFIKKYHFQGNAQAQLYIGLFYKNRLVAVMSFSKSRFNKNCDWELVRYCTVAMFNIIGGAGKLFAWFRRNYPGSVVSYADRRWSQGNLYKQLGFELIRETEPNYFYFKKEKIRYTRNKFQKHKLHKELRKFDSSLSEWENMKRNGYNKIYDCGNFTFLHP